MPNLKDNLSKSGSGVICGCFDYMTSTSDDPYILIHLPNSELHTILISLLSQLNQDIHPDITKIVLSVDSKKKFQKKSTPINNYLEKKFSYRCSVVEKGTVEFMREFSRSSIVIITGKKDLLFHRFFSDRGEKLLIHIHHGIITKSHGNLKSDKLSKRRLNDSTNIDPYPYGRELWFDRLDVKSVASEIEKHMHSAGEARSPSSFKKWGYPRFDRIDQIINDSSTSRIIPKRSQQALENDDRFKILFAPTKRSKQSIHPFRLPDFDVSSLVEKLEEHNSVVYIRMHYSEEENNKYKEYIDGEYIKYGGYDFSPSSVEILDYFDGIITDYSSIYTDYIKYDRPIIFLNKNKGKRVDIDRGIAFDYDTFFPGPKVSDMDELNNEIMNVINGVDQWEKERMLVREILIPENKKFLDYMFNEFQNMK